MENDEESFIDETKTQNEIIEEKDDYVDEQNKEHQEEEIEYEDMK